MHHAVSWNDGHNVLKSTSPQDRNTTLLFHKQNFF